jgi:fructose-1,6-bisphosphatase/inositol monophosphatase family enzyme
MPLNALERSALELFKDGDELGEGLEVTEANLYTVGLNAAIRAGEILKYYRNHPLEIVQTKKPDGTPQTNVDVEAEFLIRGILRHSFPDHTILGEEKKYGKGNDPAVEKKKRYKWAVDPIDATFAYLSYEDTCAVTICLYEDDEVIFSLVYNPFTGEIFHTYRDEAARMITRRGFSEEASGFDLPLESINPHWRFANVPPAPRNDEIYDLIRELRNGEGREGQKVQKLLQSGGSPAYALGGMCKGYFAWVNNWTGGPTEPWDLGAGIHLVRNSRQTVDGNIVREGQVTDLEGNDIPWTGYEGIVVASLNERFHWRLLETLSVLK